MKKRLSFFLRYLTTSRHFRIWRSRWLPPRVLVAVGLMILFMVGLVWSARAEPPPRRVDKSDLQPVMALKQGLISIQQPAQETAVPAETQENLRPTRTPLPPEYLSNSSQTIGITLAAVILVIIVVIGVLLFLPRRDET